MNDTHTNLLIILSLLIIAVYSLYLGENNLASGCIGSLATALTCIVKGQNNEKKPAVADPPGPADHNGV